MQSIIRSRLQASRKELLDLGLRNPLINYRRLRSRGVQVLSERSVEVFRLLVAEEKPLYFIPAKEGANDAPPPANTAAYTDNKLQTGELEASLQKRLLQTYYAAKTSIEEQGVNILYLALGMVHWYESDNSAETRRAPALLVPVTLERSTARERFSLRYTLEDVGSNLSMEAKVKAEWGVQLPTLPEEEEWTLESFFSQLENALDPLHRWKLERDEIELGFFSFGKFMIYHDLDDEQWPAGKNPVEHSLLQSLLHHGFSDGAPTVSETDFIDYVAPAQELFQVVDADSSQVLAMLAVHEGKNLVIQGPPGTGKSQTITNIIAHAIGQGKTVLFVAEKLAALEVVKRRLDTLHLGEACLELHSHKANKKGLHAELRRVMELGKPAVQHLQQQVGLLTSLRDELNDYCGAVNKEIQNSGFTAHSVVGLLLQINEQAAGVTLPRIPIALWHQWNTTKMQEAEAMASGMEARLKELGVPAKNAFWGVGLRVLLPQQQEILLETLRAALQQTTALTDGLQSIAAAHHLPSPQSREDTHLLANALELLSQNPGVSGRAISQPTWVEKAANISNWLQDGYHAAALQQQYSDALLPLAWDQDVLPIREALVAHGDQWFRFIYSAYNKAVKRLQSLVQPPLPKTQKERLQMVDAIIEMQRLKPAVQQPNFDAATLFGHSWQGMDSNWSLLQKQFEFAQQVHQQLAARKIPPQFFNAVAANVNQPTTVANHQQLLQQLNAHGRLVQLVAEKLQLDEGLLFGGKTFLAQPFLAQMEWLQKWLDQLPQVHGAISWNNLADAAGNAGLDALVHTGSHWEGAAKYLKLALQKSWCEYLLEQALQQEPALRRFERNRHEALIDQFAKLDVLNLQLNRAKAALVHWEGMPEPEGGGQMQILRTEFNKKSRHKPIRKLMADAGLAIQAIKPVLMMSPLSIANFLPPGSMEFDLVIFDEASQVRPVDALGAIIRGKQLVVVGDSKQLPPTSFFDAVTGEPDEESESVTADMQSILGLCDAQGAPQRMLRWHYRSRHQSLIQVSNHEFYENKLVVFPAAGQKQQAGLYFHHLPDSVYMRGTTRTNPMEAQTVVAAILHHARKHPKLSLGVAAFSTAQRQAIQDELEQQRKANPDVEAFFSSHKEEPFFIKNLENVQGDERDVIFISIGYGRDNEGYFSMSFGPLNAEGGERRLNVLITRAKLRCEVFSNVTAADIDLGKTQSAGIAALKRFLHFAQHGQMDLPTATGLPAQSPFEETVAQRLVQLGYKVHRQVGSIGFYIDMAIVDPEHSGRYLIGIECDGASYHSARSARDRDRLRQQVLEAMGWTIHRIWSTDWFRNPEQELARVVAAIEQSWKVQLDNPEEEDLPGTDTSLIREEVIATSNGLEAYKVAQLPAEIATREVHLHPVGKMARWVEMVVATESPVHEEEIIRRMVEAAGVTRIGPRIRDHIRLAIRFTEGSGRIERKEQFLWYAGHSLAPLRDRSGLAAASRKFKYIAPEEVAGVLLKIVGDAVAIDPEAAFPLVAKALGFSRVTEEMRQDILNVIPSLVRADILVQEGSVITLK
jgi:very-short-patch-repair endonuclease